MPPFYDPFFLSLTSQRPAKSVIIIANEPPRILSIFLYTTENRGKHDGGRYIPMSINHLPNSFLISQRYYKLYNNATYSDFCICTIKKHWISQWAIFSVHCFGVEYSGLEPLTSTLPVLRSTRWANTPCFGFEGANVPDMLQFCKRYVRFLLWFVRKFMRNHVESRKAKATTALSSKIIAVR